MDGLMYVYIYVCMDGWVDGGREGGKVVLDS